MAAFQQTPGKYTVFVTGGNANVGYKARMNFFRGGQRRGYSTGSPSPRTTTRITGPGQLLKDIPSSVLDEVVMYLNIPSPLRNNWKAIAAELSFSFQTIQSLDYHGRGGMMKGVLEIMFQKRMTVQDFANVLEKIERPDIVDVLIKAGFPESKIRHRNSNDDGDNDDFCSNKDFQDVTIVTRDVTFQSTRTLKSVHDYEQKSPLKQYKQLVKDLPKEQNLCKDPNITNGICVHEVPSSVDNFQDVQDHLGKSVVGEELTSGTQCEGLKYSVIQIESSAGESDEVIVFENSSVGGSIFERLARFIFNVYSRLCGRLTFREN